MKYAWIENNQIRDVCPGIPEELYHPDVAALYTEQVPDDAVNGDGWVDNGLIKPVLIVPDEIIVESSLPVLTPIQFKLCFTSQERIAIKTERATDDIIDDAFDILDDSRLTEVNLNLESTKGLIDYLVMKNLITPERAVLIKQGTII